MASPRDECQPVGNRARAVLGADRAGGDHESAQCREHGGELECCADNLTERAWIHAEVSHCGFGYRAFLRRATGVAAVPLVFVVVGHPILVCLVVRLLCGRTFFPAGGRKRLVDHELRSAECEQQHDQGDSGEAPAEESGDLGPDKPHHCRPLQSGISCRRLPWDCGLCCCFGRRCSTRAPGCSGFRPRCCRVAG